MDDDGRAKMLLKTSQQALVCTRAPDEISSFSILAEQIPAPVAILNQFGQVVYVNSAWCQQLAVERRDCLGKIIADFTDSESAALNRELLRPNFDNPIEHLELAVTTGTGQIKWFEYFAFPHQTCIRVYLDPISSRRELAALKEKLAMEEARQHFYACVSHELRTSVHGVLGMAELLAQTNLDQRQREYVELLCVSSRHLSNMSTDLLSYAKLRSPTFQLDLAKIPLRDCLKTVVDEFLPLARQKNVHLRGSLDDLPCFALADATRIRQIFINLIHNALKYTDSGYVSVGVSSVRRIGQRYYELHCFVEDTGRGIPTDQLNNLFTPFWQVGHQREGVGLGLAICAQLVRLMGGDITVNSELGIGATVVFTLRVGVAGEAEVLP